MTLQKPIEIRVTCFDFASLDRLSDTEVIDYFRDILRKTNRRFLPRGVVFSETFVSRGSDGLIVHLKHEGQETCRVHFVRLRRFLTVPAVFPMPA